MVWVMEYIITRPFMEKTSSQFETAMQSAYACGEESLFLGAALHDNQCFPNIPVKIPLKMMNRHGLISGATGTGKTRTIQLLAGELSEQGIPVLLMDIKGDLSGIAKPGGKTEKVIERQKKIGLEFTGKGHPVEFFSLSALDGVRLRTTVTKFGPLLISKILELNDTQGGIVSMVFQYCNDHELPLLDWVDLKNTLNYLSDHDNQMKEYGLLSKASAGAILRKIMVLEQQGADVFLGEPLFQVSDLLRTDPSGKGYISIVRLSDLQDKPKLFSTFMLSMLADIYNTFPEVGDIQKPKLVLFFDEAHLIFDQASKALLDQIEGIVRLIRSKGVGIYFCTQSPTDLPAAVLGQLGLKIQHALRAFTAADRKNIKLAAENFPLSEYYKPDQLLTELGIGEALVTALNDKGIPTPLIAAMVSTPSSSMGILSDEEIKTINNQSLLVNKYKTTIDARSAHEILLEKMKGAEDSKQISILQSIFASTTIRQIARTIAREITRAVLALIGLGKRR